MTWFKVDDAFWGHPKQTALPPGPVALWVRAGSWSSDQLTDGLVPEHMVTMLGAKKRDAEQLVTAGLWEKVAIGYQFHEWSTWQPSRQEVLDKRAEEAERKRKWREKRAAERAEKEASDEYVSQGLSQRDKDRTSGGTDAGVPDLSRSSRTRPDPTRPEPVVSYGDDDEKQNSSEGGSHVGSARPTAPPLYSDRCGQHGHVLEPGPCGPCADVRKANVGRPKLTVVAPNFCLVHDLTFSKVCSGCRADEIAAPDEESA